MPGVNIYLQFGGELNDFLPPGRKHTQFEYMAGPTDSIKHIIESVGIPHTEVGRIHVCGESAPPSWQPSGGERVDVFPHSVPVNLVTDRFVLDGHLGRLAAYLRMLGFDVLYDRLADDALLASISAAERRVLLTRDVALLKRREVERGYWVRSYKPQDQLREITTRFKLNSAFAPFKRCMECNGLLQPAAKADVADSVPPYIRETKNEFSRCSECGKVYWRGSHYLRMLRLIAELDSSIVPPHSPHTREE